MMGSVQEDPDQVEELGDCNRGRGDREEGI